MTTELTMTRIDFDRDEIPVSKKLDIDGHLYTLELHYNELYDFYSITVYDDTTQPIVSSRLVYMGNVFATGNPGFPDRKLVPLNVADLAKDYPSGYEVNKETFGNTVHLYLI